MRREELSLRIKLTLFLILPIAFYLIPTEGIYHGHSICPIKMIFGVECPGCGMTRAVFSLMYGRIMEAVDFNKFVLLIFPIMVGYWMVDIRLMFERLRGVRLLTPYSRLPRRWQPMEHSLRQ